MSIDPQQQTRHIAHEIYLELALSSKKEENRKDLFLDKKIIFFFFRLSKKKPRKYFFISMNVTEKQKKSNGVELSRATGVLER